MKDGFFIYWFISYTIGIISLFVSLLVYAINRDIQIRNHMYLMVAFTGIVIAETLGSYFDASHGHFQVFTLLRFVRGLSTCILIHALVYFIHTLFPLKWSHRVTRLAGVIAIACSIALIVSYALHNVETVVNIKLVFLAVSITWSVGVFLYHVRLHPWDDYMKMGLVISLVTIVLLPGFVIVDFYNLDILPVHVPRRIVVLPGFYLFWNSMFLFVLIKDFIRQKSIIVELDDTAADRYELTFRERQVARLLILGNKYTEIGRELEITLPTVKTHVSNIFDKTGTRSRTTLIHKLIKTL